MARVNAPDPLAIAALVHIHIAVIGPELTLFTAPAPTCGQHRELCPALPALSGHAALDAARLARDLSACALPSTSAPLEMRRRARRELVAFLVEARYMGRGHHRDRVGQVGAAQETDEEGPKNTQMKILEDFVGENR